MSSPFTVDADGALHLAPRVIPVPKTISAAAQAFLASVPRMEIAEPPTLSDVEGWRRHVRDVNANPFMTVSEETIRGVDADIQTEVLAGVTVHIASPRKSTPRTASRIYVDIHGGAFISGGGNLARLRAARAATDLDCICYGVDYRMPPEHPYPAPLDDCVAVYEAVAKRHPQARLMIGGVSAGGNLAAALALRVRDEKRASSPLGVILLSPALDLTASGDTFQTHQYIDVVLRTSGGRYGQLYAAGYDLKDPYLSPLFGDFKKGFPPTFLQSGTRDILLSNVVRMQRALCSAGIPVDLQLWEAMPHGGFGPAPETLEVTAQIRRFVDRYWS